jgi:hypothetical protein
MRIKSKVIEIPPNQTPTQVEALLDPILNQGWTLLQLYQFGAKNFAILIKTIAV